MSVSRRGTRGHAVTVDGATVHRWAEALPREPTYGERTHGEEVVRQMYSQRTCEVAGR